MDSEIIKRRLLEQEEYVKKTFGKKMIPRENFALYLKQLDTRLIKAIMGPRRAGKTTLGLLLLEKRDFYYVNFDDEVLVTLKQEELGFLLEMLTELFGKRRYLFLDEIQNIVSWELFVNRLQRIDYNIIISGSNSHLLSKELSSHLGGRVIALEIFPFNFKEFLKTRKFEGFKETDEGIGEIKNRLREFILLGGYPEILLEINSELRKNYYNELFNTIIFRDITQRFKIKYTSELVTLANILLNQFSARISLTKIAKDLGMSVHTVAKYISYFEEAYLFLISKKFSYKPREMEFSFKKYYCIDTGLLNSKKTTSTVDFGKLLENVVAIELKRRGHCLYHYIADNKYEVDFVIRINNAIGEVIQVVNDEKGLPEREMKTGLVACKRLKCSKLTVITWNKESRIKRDGIGVQIIPLWKWLLK